MKRPRTRGSARKYPQGPSRPQRRTRNRALSAKDLDHPQALGSLNSFIDLSSDTLTSHTPILEEVPVDISSQHKPSGSSLPRPLSTPLSESNSQETPSPSDNQRTTEYYYRVPYKFIMEVDGLIVKYRMEIPDANECIQGYINLAHILPPGSSWRLLPSFRQPSILSMSMHVTYETFILIFPSLFPSLLSLKRTGILYGFVHDGKEMNTIVERVVGSYHSASYVGTKIYTDIWWSWYMLEQIWNV